MPVKGLDRWRNEQLKPLPKYVHGEFLQAKRRTEIVERKIKELEALEDREIDTEGYFSRDPLSKYYDLWLEAQLKQGHYYESDSSLYAVAYQSCWPEESDSMIFQYFRTELNIRFKWWALARWSGGSLHLQRCKSKIIYGALPNINGTVFACHGDYGERMAFGSKLQRTVELYNFASSPNLRESTMITACYAGTAAAFQYCDLKVKRGAEEEVTNIAKLCIELMEKPNVDWSMIRSQQCRLCARAKEDRHIKTVRALYPSGDSALTKLKKLENLIGFSSSGTIEKLLETLSEDELLQMTVNLEPAPECTLCIFKEETTQQAKKIYNFVKPKFDVEVEKLKERRSPANNPLNETLTPF